MNNDWEIEQWVEEKAQMPFFSFYPSLPAKELHISPAETYIGLMGLVKQGKLLLRCEIRCPECSTTLYRETGNLPLSFYCKYCNLDLAIDNDIVVPVFSFSPRYIEFIKNKKKRNHQLITI